MKGPTSKDKCFLRSKGLSYMSSRPKWRDLRAHLVEPVIEITWPRVELVEVAEPVFSDLSRMIRFA